MANRLGEGVREITQMEELIEKYLLKVYLIIKKENTNQWKRFKKSQIKFI